MQLQHRQAEMQLVQQQLAARHTLVTEQQHETHGLEWAQLLSIHDDLDAQMRKRHQDERKLQTKDFKKKTDELRRDFQRSVRIKPEDAKVLAASGSLGRGAQRRMEKEEWEAHRSQVMESAAADLAEQQRQELRTFKEVRAPRGVAVPAAHGARPRSRRRS